VYLDIVLEMISPLIVIHHKGGLDMDTKEQLETKIQFLKAHREVVYRWYIKFAHPVDLEELEELDSRLEDLEAMLKVREETQ